MSAVDAFFEGLWEDYATIAPSAVIIHELFRGRGERVLNDHVAFRTLSGPEIGLDALEPRLVELGYTRFATYRFEAKHLNARSYVPADPRHPRVFLSELCRNEFDGRARAILDRICLEIPGDAAASLDVFKAGPLWRLVSVADYEVLAARSEYAAWVAAHGMHANHFTISVNQLEQTPTVESVLRIVEAAGFEISDAGGRVKGSRGVLLEQGSTRADRALVRFSDGEIRVPTCYTEFALRHKDGGGRLFDGFVVGSADRIFESTVR